jgi:hypothetical protein
MKTAKKPHPVGCALLKLLSVAIEIGGFLLREMFANAFYLTPSYMNMEVRTTLFD